MIVCEATENLTVDPDDIHWSGSIPAHANAENAEKTLQGSIEPLVGWEMQKDGRQSMGLSTIAFVPGSCIKNDAVKFTVGAYGVWELGR